MFDNVMSALCTRVSDMTHRSPIFVLRSDDVGKKSLKCALPEHCHTHTHTHRHTHTHSHTHIHIYTHIPTHSLSHTPRQIHTLHTHRHTLSHSYTYKKTLKRKEQRRNWKRRNRERGKSVTKYVILLTHSTSQILEFNVITKSFHLQTQSSIFAILNNENILRSKAAHTLSPNLHRNFHPKLKLLMRTHSPYLVRG